MLGEIEDAKEELKSLDDSQKCRLAALSTECDDMEKLAPDDSQNCLLAALSIECDDFKESALDGLRTWNDVFAWAQNEKGIRQTLGFEDLRGIPLSILESFSTAHLRTVLFNNENLRNLLDGVSPRVDFNPSLKKRKLIEWSSAKLAHYFSWEVYALENLNELDNVSEIQTINMPLLDDIVQANKIISKLNSLRQNHTWIEQCLRPPAPRFILDDQCSTQSAATLNSSLNEVFQLRQTHGRSLQYLLKSICHLLLASKVAPTIETYILLAKNFDDLGEQRLVQLVLDAIRECNFRLNEEALIFFLDYYAKTHNWVDFQLLVGQIRGYGNGLGSVQARLGLKREPTMLPRIAFDMYRLDERKMRLSFKCSSFKKFNAPKNEMWSLKYRVARMDQDVYTSLIRGTLQFADGMKAMGHYIDLISEGHKPTVEMLTAILSWCYDQQDWRSCLRILYEIQTIAGANLQTYRWTLRLFRKCQDKEAYKESLADGIRRRIISPAVQYFPEEIEAMEADLLLDFAKENDEISQEWKDEEISSEPFGRLARRLGEIIDQLAETAFEFGSMRLSHGLGPTKEFFLYTRITYYGANFAHWAAREKNRVYRSSDEVVDLTSRTPNSLVNHSSGSHKLSGRVDFPGIEKVNSDVENQIALRLRRKHASIWYPLLRILVDEFRKLRRLLHNLAQELGNIEFLIRHGPTVGHMLHSKMLLLRAKSLRSVKWTEQTSSPSVHDWMKENQNALPTLRGPKEETMRLKEPADQMDLFQDDCRLLPRKRDAQLHGEPAREVPDFGKTMNKSSEVERSSSRLEDILREAVHIENILNL